MKHMRTLKHPLPNDVPWRGSSASSTTRPSRSFFSEAYFFASVLTR